MKHKLRRQKMTINPYLNFDGNTEGAFNFYKSVFGGEFAALMRYKDIPAQEGCAERNISGDQLEKIMHIALPIGDGNILMGTDAVASMAEKLIAGNNFSISIDAESKEEAERIFNGLADGGTIIMPLADAFWGAYFGMFTDKFGIEWMVNYDSRRQ